MAQNTIRAGPDDCWLWTGSRNRSRDGSPSYGRIFFDGKTRKAHRVAYELAHGPIPYGLFACHKCDNPRCVNPAHIFLGTAFDNVEDRRSKGRVSVPKKLVCSRGHPMADGNVYYGPSRGSLGGIGRHCRRCAIDAATERNKRLRLAKGPKPPRTHCRNGHPATEENTIRSIRKYSGGGPRITCRECRKVAAMRHYHANELKSRADAMERYRRNREKICARRRVKKKMVGTSFEVPTISNVQPI